MWTVCPSRRRKSLPILMKQVPLQKNNMRITFTAYDAAHLYELCSQHFTQACYSCDSIKKWLENIIGEKEVHAVKRILKKSPYICPENVVKH